MNRLRLIAIIELTLAVIAWGGSFVATKIAVQEIPPALVVWLRFAIGVLILGFAVIVRRQFIPPHRKDLLYFALLGFLGITFHQWLQSTGLLTAQATTTAWIVATTPVFMALLGWAILREKMLNWQWWGIGLAALGVLLVVSQGDLTAMFQGNFGSPGDFLILISSANWAVFSALSRRGLRKYPATLMIFYVMTIGWLMSTVLVLIGPGLAPVSQLSQAGWLAVGFLGVFCSGLAYIFWYDGLKILPVGQAGAFIYLEPFVTVIVAALLLQEPFGWSSMVGGGLILVGVWLVQKQ